jgi:hypothetical protein
MRVMSSDVGWNSQEVFSSVHHEQLRPQEFQRSSLSVQRMLNRIL